VCSAQDGNVLARVLGTCAAALVLDQATKRWAVSALSDGPTGEWLGVRFNLHFNPGASFSTFADGSAGPVLGILAFVIALALLRAGYKATDRWSRYIYAIIAGGALGNFADRLVRAEDGILSGTVVDFIDFGWWPVFNVADMALVGGVGLLVLATLLTPDDPDTEQ
jgi:signal peptidase II